MAAEPPAWPSPACPRLIPLLQTLSLTPADKSHFQDGLIQFSTDFLPGPVTYGSPAGAGQHVTPQRPPSLEQLSTGCCSLISPGRRGRGPHPALAPHPAVPWLREAARPQHSHQDAALEMWGWWATQDRGNWYPGWYPGMLAVVPRDAGIDTQGCWQQYPEMLAVIPKGVGSGTQGCWQNHPGMLMLIPRDAGSDIQRRGWWYPGMLAVILSGARAAGEAARG